MARGKQVKAAAVHQDVDAADTARKRSAANRLANTVFIYDVYLLPVAALWVFWSVYVAPTATVVGTVAATTKAVAFQMSTWFTALIATPIIVIFWSLVLGVNQYRVDSDKHMLLWVLCACCGGAGVTSLLSLLSSPDPFTLLATAFSFGFAYLHFNAASAFIAGPPVFSANGPALSKTEAVVARMVLLVDTGVLGCLVAFRLMDGLKTGDILSLPVAMLLGVGLFALLCLRASASPCIQQLRHAAQAGFIFFVCLFFSTVNFVPDWTTGTVRMVAIIGLVAHTVCFVTPPLLNVYLVKWGRFKRFVKNYNPGEAYSQE